jgi:D-lactate dehydrogenase
MMEPTTTQFLTEISRFIPRKRIYTDELRRLAWGTDAGFYRMIPQIVIRSENEEEVSRLLAIAGRLNVPVTFRAAGTSLSGQAISDSTVKDTMVLRRLKNSHWSFMILCRFAQNE